MEINSSTKNEWDRQENETVRHYKYFCAFLKSGNGRSLRKIAKELEITLNSAEKFSVQHSWFKRAEAYDLHILEEFKSQYKLELNDTYSIFLKALKKPAIALLKKLEKDPLALEKLSIEKLYRLVINAAKILPNLANATDLNVDSYLNSKSLEGDEDDDIDELLTNKDNRESINELIKKL